MQATRYLFNKMPHMKSNIPLPDITLHQHLRNRAGEIIKTANAIINEGDLFIPPGSYAAIVGAVTTLEGMEYLGKKYPHNK